MSKRKPKVLPPKGPSKPKREHPDSLRAPNHMVPLTIPAKPEKRAASQRYPLLQLALPDSPGSGQPGQLAFFDKLHKLVCAYDRDTGSPPSWMDPEVFVRMVRQDPRLAKQKRWSAKQLAPILQEVFEETYLPYMLDRFEEVLPLLVEWLAAHYAYLDTKTS